MPTFLNTAEGHTNGQTITTANSGGASGDAWNTVSTGTGSTHTATNELAAHGNLSIEMSHAVSGGAHRLMRNFAEAGRTVVEARFFISSLPTDFEDVLGVRHSSGNMFTLSIGGDGKLVIVNSAGAGISDSRAPQTIPVAQWVTIQAEVTKGTTTSNGLIGYRYYQGTNTTGTPTHTWSSTAMNAGTTNAASVWIGRSTSRNEARTVRYDTVRAQSLTTGWPAAYVPATQAPTIELDTNPNGIEPGTTQDLNINTTDPDNTITALTIQQVSGTPIVTLTGSGANWSYTAPPTIAGTTLGFTATATNTAGPQVVSPTTTHTIYPSTERVGTLPAYLRVGQ